MKISELIKKLKSYPPDTPVVACWDDGWSSLEEHSIEKDHKGTNVLVFDVNEYGTYQA